MSTTTVDLYFEGTLLFETNMTPVSVRYASRYSLFLRFDGRKPRDHNNRFDKLVLQVDGKTIEMGPCQIMEDDEAAAGEYRLVPLSSIPDFEKLFFRSRVTVLESVAVNLPLILSYKNSIDAEFATYVSELSYDLSANKAVFDQIDTEIADEPDHVREAVQAGILGSLGTRLLDELDRHHLRLREITAKFADQEHEHHGFYFRKQLWNSILCAPIMARTNLKPRGYIGDSEMMRMIYLNTFQGESTFGKILHKHAIGQGAAQAVRNRRGDLAGILREFVNANGHQEGERAKVLSVACGPAMELNEIFLTTEDCNSVHFSLLDQDRQALLEAAGVVERIEDRLDAEISADFIKESVRTMLVTRELQDRWGQFDFIYSMGLFDYLTKPVAIAVTRKLYNLLLPGGEMVIGNFSSDNPSMVYMAYWMDWVIVYRTEEQMLELAAELDGCSATVERDETGIQLLLRIKKEGGVG